ncbi:MAG: hypothetical protein QOC93_1164 [Actinomycetota bacterium]|jgi:hypothetical protein|nr:hypothetical protein [Cryptosporangiaceae bacterium]MDQ1676020.1 hypothetical protein [Actinomycetota bacterium]
MDVVTCPECGAPAEAESWGEADSTDGPIELVRTRCARRHCLVLPRTSLVATERAARDDRGERTGGS